MFKEVKYNQSFKKRARQSVYKQEYDLLHEFFAGDKQNMRIEYHNNKSAIYAKNGIVRYIQKARIPLDIARRGNFIFVTRKDGADNAES